MIDIHEILNGPRNGLYYRTPPNSPRTLDAVKQAADADLYNGPEGNEIILRLMEIIEAQQKRIEDLDHGQP